MKTIISSRSVTPRPALGKKLAAFAVLVIVVPMITGGWYFGGDSNSSPPSQSGTHVQFWIGELGTNNPGAGVCVNASQDFVTNPGAADAKRNDGSDRDVSSYWFLQGPESDGDLTGANAYNLGVHEATDAFNCWYAEYGAGIAGNLTIFGDMEDNPGFTDGSWYPPPYLCFCKTDTRWQANVNVISGFWGQMHALAATDGGIYTSILFAEGGPYTPGGSTDATGHIEGQVWAGNSFVLWPTAACNAEDIIEPSSEQSVTYNETLAVNWHTQNKANRCLIGGQGAAVIQYFGSMDADHDITAQQGPPTACVKDYYHKTTCITGGIFKNGWGDGTK